MKLRPGIALFVLLACIAVNGCSAPEVKEAPPSVSELPNIEATLLSDSQWTSPAVCWVGRRDRIRSSWKIEHTPELKNRRSRKESLDRLESEIRDVLVQEGLAVNSFGDDMYLTRQQRLSTDIQIFIKGFSLEQIRVQEGHCFDAQIVLEIERYPDASQVVECVVPGRIVMAEGQSNPISAVRKRCLGNITRVPEFRRACSWHRQQQGEHSVAGVQGSEVYDGDNEL